MNKMKQGRNRKVQNRNKHKQKQKQKKELAGRQQILRSRPE